MNYDAAPPSRQGNTRGTPTPDPMKRIALIWKRFCILVVLACMGMNCAFWLYWISYMIANGQVLLALFGTGAIGLLTWAFIIPLLRHW